MSCLAYGSTDTAYKVSLICFRSPTREATGSRMSKRRTWRQMARPQFAADSIRWASQRLSAHQSSTSNIFGHVALATRERVIDGCALYHVSVVLEVFRNWKRVCNACYVSGDVARPSFKWCFEMEFEAHSQVATRSSRMEKPHG